ncbi:MAG TPA: N-methyl-L-tryptophan oxidase [Bryobacteraceae bacterium]|nr:N-methyl-L-tryptophan oxidase [Bryobacteraceae bacterium]
MLQAAYDVTVVGAGSFGAWTAWHLARAGRSVLLLDAWGPGHTRSSSGDETRVIRMGYGTDDVYTRMAMRSLELWQELCRETGQPLFHRTGVLRMARDGDPYNDGTYRTLAAAGVEMEILRSGEIGRRYTQMSVEDPQVYGILEPASGALMARRGVACTVEDAIRRGAEYRTEAVLAPATDGRQAQVCTVSGQSIRSGAIVFACGAWLAKLFPQLLGARIFPTRQEIFYFAPPAGDRRFAPPQLPVWIDFSDPRGPYGIPDIESRGFKLGFDRHGEAFDPDTGDRRLSSAGLEEAYRFLAERFPDLAHAPLVESRVCQYENSWNGDFLLDRHPGFDNVWLAGGGSGHGFKHGPAVGEYLSGQILGGGRTEPRFSLQSKAEQRARTVY